MLQLVVDNRNGILPGFKIQHDPALKQWLKTRGYVWDNGRHNTWIHYPTGQEMQLFSLYSSIFDDYALEFVRSNTYIDGVVNVEMWYKLTSTSAPIKL